MPSVNEGIQLHFRIICRKCGSDNCVIDIDRGFGGSDLTAADDDTITMGCNACQQNDLFVWPDGTVSALTERSR